MMKFRLLGTGISEDLSAFELYVSLFLDKCRLCFNAGMEEIFNLVNSIT